MEESLTVMPLKQSLDVSLALPLIHDEPKWRTPQALDRVANGQSKVVVSRWTALDNEACDVTAEVAGCYHTIAIALRHMNVAFFVSGRPIHDGHVLPGMLQVSGPGEKARAIFRGPCDILHLHVSQALVAECLGQAHGCEDPGEIRLIDPRFSQDRVIEQLGHVLLMAHDAGSAFGETYAEGVSIAILMRLLDLSTNAGLASGRRGGAALPRWRIKRAVDYIDAHLGQPITLGKMAEATGLTRMHFAAQFRAATGIRPHEYLLRKRIERARDLLLTSNASLVEVALNVGFQTQAHFTTVFKRFVGETPHRWRCANDTRMPFGSGNGAIVARYQSGAYSQSVTTAAI
jgi:AraC family transcriptional regulator